MSKTLVFWIEPPFTYPPWSGIHINQPANANDFERAIRQLNENPDFAATVIVSNLKNMYNWWGKDTTSTLISKLVDVCSRHGIKLMVAPDLDYAKNYMERERNR